MEYKHMNGRLVGPRKKIKDRRREIKMEKALQEFEIQNLMETRHPTSISYEL